MSTLSEPEERQVLEALRESEKAELSAGAIAQRTDLTRFRTLQAIESLAEQNRIQETRQVGHRIPLYALAGGA